MIKSIPVAARMDWVSTAITGLVLGFIEVILALSLASLIFSGTLSSFLSRGIGIVLLTAVVHLLFTSIFASHKALTSSVQSDPVTILTVAIAALMAPLAADASVIPTVFMLIILTTTLSGAAMTLLGVFQLGKMVRYIPYPVIGGFIGGTGWLLASGSLQVMVEQINSDQLIMLLPGIAFGVILFFGLRIFWHPFTLPGLIVGGLAAFFMVLAFTGTSLDMAAAQGLTLGIDEPIYWRPMSLEELSSVNWEAIFGQVGNIGALLVVTIISMLLGVTGIEQGLRQDIDLNRELRTAGIANLLAGVGGGTIGYHGISLTMLNFRMTQGGKKWAGIIAGLFCLFILFGGAAVLAYIPRFILGGLLFYLGLEFMYRWIVQGYYGLGRMDYAVMITIIVAVILWGFLVAVILGLALMVLLFVIQSSRVKILRNVMTGNEIVSHIMRSTGEISLLEERKQSIYLLELQGFLFFGTATGVLEKVHERLADSSQPPLKYLILDMHYIIGLDSSAAYSLNKVKYLSDEHDFMLIFSNLSEKRRQILTRSGLDCEFIFEDVHHALEWCEDQLLQDYAEDDTDEPHTLETLLQGCGLTSVGIVRLREYLEPVELAPGEILMNEGETANDLYFIESGQLSAYVDMNTADEMRVQKLTEGTTVGELAFFLNTPRTATVVASTAAMVYRLSTHALDVITTKDPPLAIAVNRLVGRLISERLAAANRERAALNR